MSISHQILHPFLALVYLFVLFSRIVKHTALFSTNMVAKTYTYISLQHDDVRENTERMENNLIQLKPNQQF